MQTQRGFTYLGVLFFVAITAAALAALGQAWSTAAQRERERELEFRGEAIASAIISYRKAQPERPQYPRSLDDLLEDRRGINPRHHLRQAYVDPFTGKPDWVLVPQPGEAGVFSAVHSQSERPLLRQSTPEGVAIAKAQDWVFSATPKAAQTDPAAAPSGDPRPASAPSP